MQSQTNRKRRTQNTSRLTVCALLSTVALIFSYIEAIVPLFPSVPGVKLGIANLVIIIALYQMNFRYAIVINLIRICLSGLLFSGLFATLYSMAGAFVAMAIMLILYKSKMFSIIGVSLGGAVGHNLGQIITASIIVENGNLFLYFPVLLFSGIATGLSIGICGYFLIRKLPASLFKSIGFEVPKL